MEKKVFTIYLLLLLIVSSFVLLPNKSPIFALSSGKEYEYCFYSRSEVIDINDATIVKNGNVNFIKCSGENAKKVKSQLINLDGESVTFQGTKNDALKFIHQFNYEIVYSEMVGKIFTLYAYSPQISNCVYVNNQKVNLEVAVTNSTVTVGTPVILGSY